MAVVVEGIRRCKGSPWTGHCGARMLWLWLPKTVPCAISASSNPRCAFAYHWQVSVRGVGYPFATVECRGCRVAKHYYGNMRSAGLLRGNGDGGNGARRRLGGSDTPSSKGQPNAASRGPRGS
jgi:hypothetical protein